MHPDPKHYDPSRFDPRRIDPQTAPGVDVVPAIAATMDTEIETARLLLRPAREADIAAIAALANDEAVTVMTARMPHPYTLADAAAYVARQRDERETGAGLGFVIERQSDAALLGCISTSTRPDGTSVLGYWLGRPFWGSGYATEAARAVIDHVFLATPTTAVTAACRVVNAPSRRVLEKCGLRYIESGLDPAPARGGAQPVDRFRLSRRDWESFKAWRPALVRPRAVPRETVEAG